MNSIIDFLKSQGWNYDETSQELSKSFRAPSTTMIINGQRIEQPGADRILKVQYVGEGILFDNGEDRTIYGFNIGSDSVWVKDIDDFRFWINLDNITR